MKIETLLSRTYEKPRGDKAVLSLVFDGFYYYVCSNTDERRFDVTAHRYAKDLYDRLQAKYDRDYKFIK